jgi:hypothetical protein
VTPRWRRRRLGTPVDGQPLVDESVLFLTGGLASHLLASGRQVPGWAWLGFLAHTPGAELEDRTGELVTVAGAVPGTTPWGGAVALLAHEIVETARDSGCDVAQVQRSIVQGLEVDGDRIALVDAVGPSRFVQVVRHELARGRNRRER